MVKLILAFLLISLCSSGLLASSVDKQNVNEKEHYQNSEHNPDYDHRQFLGEEAKTFDQLSPEESKKRLLIIVDKIDKDADGLVTQDELRDWIKYTQKKYIQDDINNHWKTHVPINENKVTWQTYKKTVYGFMDSIDPVELEKDDQGASYMQMLKRDRRRWQLADKDDDDALTKEEYAGFLHPEEVEHMKGIVIVEMMEDIDKDKDGKVSLEEYIGDMYRGGGGSEEEPDWVSQEREDFVQHRDKDKDGFLNEEEVRDWILPNDFDHAKAEAQHLIYESDQDSDQKLTKDEILGKFDLFVGSQATDFGEALNRHDEF